MNTYLIMYGADNEMATFEAENVEEAIEQFVESEIASDDMDDARNAISGVMICTDVEWSA